MLEPKPKSSPIPLFDDGNPYTIDRVISFYSHTRRSPLEVKEDESLGINRLVFSNLYDLRNPLIVLEDENVLRVPSDGSEFPLVRDCLFGKPLRSTENLFQAAKCVTDADALLYSKLNGANAARYGQGRLSLSNRYKKMLIDFGIPEDQFGGKSKKWTRTKESKRPPCRERWEDIKRVVMMEALRMKFSITSERDATCASTIRALCESRENVFFVEHTSNDRQWGDGGDGKGCNYLGKLLTQLVLEMREGKRYDIDDEFMNKPNSCFLHYSSS